MASLDMEGSYEFTSTRIDEVVTRKSPGNYALGYVDDEGTFRVQYVGRSDVDVNQELKARLSSEYKKFKYSYATSPKAAFEKECENYHDFGGKRNKRHPGRPNGTNWKCPRCSIFG